VDWRQRADPRRDLAELSEGPIVIWVEGEDQEAWDAMDGRDRQSLGSSSVLAVWTAPPGPTELAYVLEAVNPAVVYLIGAEPVTAEYRPFVERLAGMVKHDLRMRDGQVNLGRLAAALGHRETTVRVGLQWLAARGQVSVIESDEDTIRLRFGGEPSPDWQKLESQLRQLLGETAAYRRHFRSAAAEELGISD
jgi:single-stranded-DNA-specific exonuclease